MQEKILKLKRKLLVRLLLFLTAFALFVPIFVNNIRQSSNFLAGNVIFFVDLSNSMNVDDVFYNGIQTSRLELAKKIVEDNVKSLNHQFGLAIWSDKFDFLVLPTLDKQTFLAYLQTLNSNLLNGGKSDFYKSLNQLKKVLNPSDIVVILSDFDFPYKKIKLNNPVYLIALGNKYPGLVKNADGQTLYQGNQVLSSSVNLNTLKKLAKDLNAKHYHLTDYKKGQILPFLENIKTVNYQTKHKVNYTEILSYILFILSF